MKEVLVCVINAVLGACPEFLENRKRFQLSLEDSVKTSRLCELSFEGVGVTGVGIRGKVSLSTF